MATVLIIDDETDILSLFSDVLGEAGHTVYRAANGVEGLSQIEAVQPDVVIVDMFMPEMDGIETILNIRHANPGMRVIAISGGGQSRNFAFLETSPEMGADLTLHKPIFPDELVSHVESCLRKG